MRRPKAFISYSWDSESHKVWVKNLSDRLRKDGVETHLDQADLALGDRLPTFMEQIAICDYVLFICTPRYKQKADARTGGVGYEGNIITGELLNTGNERKFIPVLAAGRWTESLPTYATGKLGADLSDPARFEEGYANILGTLLKKSIHARAAAVAPAPASSPTASPSAPLAGSSIRILGLILDEVTEPRNDGTPGSALYKVPFQLSSAPSSLWVNLFLEEWKWPRQFTSMHRPGTARVSGDRIILDGVTIEEVRDFHKDTLQLCAEEANRKELELLKQQAAAAAARQARSDRHREKVRTIGSQIKFD